MSNHLCAVDWEPTNQGETSVKEQGTARTADHHPFESKLYVATY